MMKKNIQKMEKNVTKTFYDVDFGNNHYFGGGCWV
jgi:hypothetical protein